MSKENYDTKLVILEALPQEEDKEMLIAKANRQP